MQLFCCRVSLTFQPVAYQPNDALSPNFGPIGFLGGFCFAFQGYCWVKDKAVFNTVTFHQRSNDQHVSWDERNATIATICTQCTISEGEILACVVLSSEYVLKKANKLERDLTFQHRSSTQCVPVLFISVFTFAVNAIPKLSTIVQ